MAFQGWKDGSQSQRGGGGGGWNGQDKGRWDRSRGRGGSHAPQSELYIDERGVVVQRPSADGGRGRGGGGQSAHRNSAGRGRNGEQDVGGGLYIDAKGVVQQRGAEGPQPHQSRGQPVSRQLDMRTSASILPFFFFTTPTLRRPDLFSSRLAAPVYHFLDLIQCHNVLCSSCSSFAQVIGFLYILLGASCKKKSCPFLFQCNGS